MRMLKLNIPCCDLGVTFGRPRCPGDWRFSLSALWFFCIFFFFYLLNSTLHHTTIAFVFVQRGIYFEICYGRALSDQKARRELFTNSMVSRWADLPHPDLIRIAAIHFLG